MRFEDPLAVSPNLKYDRLYITYLDPSIFMSKKTNVTLHQSSHFILSPIKPQSPGTDFDKDVESIQKVTAGFLSVGFIVVMIVTMLVNGSLAAEYYLNLINFLQLLIYLPCL